MNLFRRSPGAETPSAQEESQAQEGRQAQEGLQGQALQTEQNSQDANAGQDIQANAQAEDNHARRRARMQHAVQMVAGRRLGRCMWVVVMALIVLALFLLYSEFSLLGVEFWSQLARLGDTPEALSYPAAAYCDTQDIMVIFGGHDSSGLAKNSLYIYEFGSSKFVDWSNATSSVVDARWGAVIANVDPHPDRPESCRFLIHGGVPDSQTRQNYASDTSVWSVEVENDGMVNVFEVDLEGDTVYGRYQSGATGIDNRMILYGGANGISESAAVQSGIWCLSLNDTATTADEAPVGVWTTLSSSGLSARFDYAHVKMTNEIWAVHGGYSRPTAAYIQSDLVYFNLTALALEAAGKTTASEQTDRAVTVTQSSAISRAGHLAARASTSIFYTYGGVRDDEVDGVASRSTVDYVALTQISSASSLAYSIGCSQRRKSYAWCGFVSQFPGDQLNAVGINRGSNLVVIRNVSGYTTLYELDGWTMVEKGSFFDALDYENASTSSMGLAAIQYVLIAACIFLLITIFIMFRHRSRRNQMGMVEMRKNPGVSQEVIDALPLIRYDEDGKHMYVKRLTDEEGNVSYEDLGEVPVEEQTYFHPRQAMNESVGSEREALVDTSNVAQQDGKSQAADTKEGDVVVTVESGVTGASAAAATVPVKQFDPKSFYANDDEGDVCAICLLPYEQDEILRELPCKHWYHDECIDPWLLRKGNCPLCKCHVVTGRPVEDDAENPEEGEGTATAAGALDLEAQGNGALAHGQDRMSSSGSDTSTSVENNRLRQAGEGSDQLTREQQASRAFLGNPVMNMMDWFRQRRQRQNNGAITRPAPEAEDSNPTNTRRGSPDL